MDQRDRITKDRISKAREREGEGEIQFLRCNSTDRPYLQSRQHPITASPETEAKWEEEGEGEREEGGRMRGRERGRKREASLHLIFLRYSSACANE